MVTIGLCMIVKNEEETLARCLDSVQGVFDEIIIVDTGSEDQTRQIAHRYTDRVYDFAWIDDFSAARNYAFSKSQMQYRMWLDADDVVDDAERIKLIELKNNLTDDVDIVMLKYATAFDEAGNPPFSYYRERIIKNDPRFFWQGMVHEVITPGGNLRYEDIYIRHKKMHEGYSDRNLRIYQRQLELQGHLSPRDRFYYARELYYHAHYDEAIQEFNGFLDDGFGWLENNIEACRFLSHCHARKGEPVLSLEALFKSLRFDAPRAEVCCDIGDKLLQEGNAKAAQFWYETALTRKRNDKSGAFISPDSYGYHPLMQLCICHFRAGNMELAEQYNEMAGKLKPNDPAYMSNRDFFARQRNNTPASYMHD